MLILVTWMTTAFLWHGRVGRRAGGLLLFSYVVYVLLHVFFR
jgi:hypothetical protein